MDSYAGTIDKGSSAVFVQVEMKGAKRVDAWISTNGGPYRETTFRPTEHPELPGEWKVHLTPIEVNQIGHIRVAFIGDGNSEHAHVNATIVPFAATNPMSPGVIATTVSQAVVPQLQELTDLVRVAMRDLLGNQMTNKPTWQRS